MQAYQTFTFTSTAECNIGAIVLYGSIADLQGELFSSEKSAIQEAVEKRQREFRAGRTLARAGLKKIGYSSQTDIPVAADRSPCWPDGIIGSITHTDTHCACAMATSDTHTSIGIDMEKIGVVRTELWEQIFTSSEQHYLMRLPKEDSPMYASLFFSAKEAFYKLQYPLTKAWLNFTDASIRVDDTHKCMIHINENTPAGRIIRDQQGHYQITESNSVLCIFML